MEIQRSTRGLTRAQVRKYLCQRPQMSALAPFGKIQDGPFGKAPPPGEPKWADFLAVSHLA